MHALQRIGMSNIVGIEPDSGSRRSFAGKERNHSDRNRSHSSAGANTRKGNGKAARRNESSKSIDCDRCDAGEKTDASSKSRTRCAAHSSDRSSRAVQHARCSTNYVGYRDRLAVIVAAWDVSNPTVRDVWQITCERAVRHVKDPHRCAPLHGDHRR